MHDLNFFLAKAIQQVEACGIKPGKPISIQYKRPGRSWGDCSKKDGGWRIRINTTLGTASESALMNTLVHEVLHTVEKCFNHGTLWLSHAATLNRKFGYTIKVKTAFDEKGISAKDSKAKYLFKCEKCDNYHEAFRKSKLTENPESFKCNCGGKLIVLRHPNMNSGNQQKTSQTKRVQKAPVKKVANATANASPFKSQELEILKMRGYKYSIVCGDCNAKTHRKVMSKTIKNIDNYKCRCGSKKLKVFKNF